MKTFRSFPFLFALLLAGCGKPTAPSNAEVLNYLNSQVPSGSALEFVSVESENFPAGEGRCTVKFKATVRCKSDLYDAADSAAALKSVGWNPSAYTDALNAISTLDEPDKSALAAKVPASLLKGVTLGAVVTKAGVEATTYGKLEADRQVDAWTFTTQDYQDASASFPGRTADQIQGSRLVVMGSDEARQLLTTEANQEKDFVATVKTAQDRLAAARQAQAQVEAEKHQQLVQTLLAATAPNQTYQGTVISSSHSAEIKLTFLTQQDGGKFITARLENPADPSQATVFSGTIAFDPAPDDRHPDLPIRLIGPPESGVRKVLADPMLDMWLRDRGSKIWFKVDSNGALTGTSIKGWNWPNGSDFSLQPQSANPPSGTPPAPTAATP